MGTDDFFSKKRKERKARRHDQRNARPNSYLIVSEGTQTEKNYFSGLSEFIKVHFGGNIDTFFPPITVSGVGRGTSVLVNETSKIVNRSTKVYENIWIVFDKDRFDDFDDAISLAESRRFKVAWSNQCFEYWLFLHFEYSDSALLPHVWEQRLNKIFIERLKTKYSKSLPNIFDLVTQNDGLKTAISNAKRRMEDLKNIDKPSQCDPATTVYKMIDELSQFLQELL